MGRPVAAADAQRQLLRLRRVDLDAECLGLCSDGHSRRHYVSIAFRRVPLTVLCIFARRSEYTARPRVHTPTLAYSHRRSVAGVGGQAARRRRRVRAALPPPALRRRDRRRLWRLQGELPLCRPPARGGIVRRLPAEGTVGRRPAAGMVPGAEAHTLSCAPPFRQNRTLQEQFSTQG